MPTSRESTQTLSSDTSAQNSNGSSTVTSFDASSTVYTGPVGGSGDGTVLTGTLDATAIGTDTFAQVSGSASVGDNGTFASFDSTAAAQGGASTTSYSSTTASVSYSGPADAYFSLTQTVNHTVTTQSSSTSTSSASASLAAVNFDPDDDGGCGFDYDPDAGAFDPDTGGGQASHDHFDSDTEIDGNLATFDLTVAAFGDDSYASLLVEAIAIEDTLSSTTAVIILAIE